MVGWGSGMYHAILLGKRSQGTVYELRTFVGQQHLGRSPTINELVPEGLSYLLTRCGTQGGNLYPFGEKVLEHENVQVSRPNSGEGSHDQPGLLCNTLTHQAGGRPLLYLTGLADMASSHVVHNIAIAAWPVVFSSHPRISLLCS